MSNTTVKKPLVAAIGVAVVGSLAVTGAVAADNPFGLKELNSGYMQTAMEGKCGGSKTTAPMEGKCGGSKAPMEGKCGESKAPIEGKCGGSGGKAMEGKCGEGKCGSSAAPAKTMEGKCGGSKAPMEGKCGGSK